MRVVGFGSMDDGFPFGMASQPVAIGLIPGTPSVADCLRVDPDHSYFRAITAHAYFYGDPAANISDLQKMLKEAYFHMVNNKFFFPAGEGNGAGLFIYHSMYGGVPLMDGNTEVLRVQSGIIPLGQIDRSITNRRILTTVLHCFRKRHAYDAGKIVARCLVGVDLVYPIYKDRLKIVLFDDVASRQLPTDVLQGIAEQVLNGNN